MGSPASDYAHHGDGYERRSGDPIVIGREEHEGGEIEIPGPER